MSWNMKSVSYIVLLSFLSICLSAQTLDVQHYQVFLEPNFAEQSISGEERIVFTYTGTEGKVLFDSGDLEVLTVRGEGVLGFVQEDQQLGIFLANKPSPEYTVDIAYRGKPKRGLVFLEPGQQVYSVFHTDEWMVCRMNPDERARFQLDLIVPPGLVTVASGTLQDSIAAIQKMRYSWKQDYETPAYTYGFAIGDWEVWQEQQKGHQLGYYAEQYTPAELAQIFRYTGNILAFFIEKTGIPLPQETYTQVLMGNHYQEMSGFAVLKESYGERILNDSTETNLISHELAHQWWGNMITCHSWNHFWLNEGMATFMSAAFNEMQFGRAKYERDVQSYRAVYEKVKARGHDKPLVFPSWSNPSGDDRRLVYFKGAYVLHLLREELGEDLFWQGIRDYTQTFYGQSVTTKDFQAALEESTGRDLAPFFEEWVY